MNAGKLVFSQIIDHLPMHTFRRCVARYQGNRYVKSFSCLDQYLCMAFAQLTYRESLRDIEACLRVQKDKLYHMGIRGGMSKSTLADANECRDWRIYADFAQALIRIARPLYANEDLGIDLDNTVYALDSSTIDLCLSIFPWALFRSTKSAVKLHTLLDLRGNIPAFDGTALQIIDFVRQANADQRTARTFRAVHQRLRNMPAGRDQAQTVDGVQGQILQFPVELD